MAAKRLRQGFTIIELLVVISIIALLIGILLPAVGKARDNARVSVSRSNLRELGVAMHNYAADWEDRQYTPVRDTMGAYGSVANYNDKVYGSPDGEIPPRWQVHPPIMWGWGAEGHMWCYIMNSSGHHWAIEPINFSGGAAYFGWFRFPNIKAIHSYLGGKSYDQVFYAPKDRLSLAAAEPCMDDPGEAVGGTPGNPGGPCNPPIWCTYCWSPAAMFDPGVFRPDDPNLPSDKRGFQSPWSLPSGFRVPSMSQIKYPGLKTHMAEHQWLQNVEVECNPAFDPFASVLDCEPYYFNHALTSQPVTLFYDGHVSFVGAHEAMLADRRHENQAGYGLWSRDTPFGDDGYFIDIGYDFAETSFHILTTEGPLGRDILGKE
ncbi:MAG: type II secretion system protein [Planctomycetota bacterium]